jgi:cyclic beta-1,2-glucan synthetase
LRSGVPLSGRTGVGLDPCAAFAAPLDVAPGATVECIALLGEGRDEEEVRGILARYRDPRAFDVALDAVRHFWRETLGGVQVETPSPELDLMVNGWLSYQNLSCRVWGRSAYYQSGGAFGFRDQLQDCAALVHLAPELTRSQIVLHAEHQFVEGDVLHWWHPPTGKGIRTHFSDDLLWLPYVAAYYLETTGDASVLDEEARFVTARALADGEDEAFVVPEDSGERASVYAHCCRALERSLTAGAHGLPLMGTGDWNDGMNRVGREGRGESVWLGFFLAHILERFVPVCQRRGDAARAARYGGYLARLVRALNAVDSGWDGRWYRRAYYDDGTPLGAARNDECRIDTIAQAWAVIARVAPVERAAQALDAMERWLVSERDGIIRLLTPAFDHTPHDPGYIKGYLPGVRENGGQYTHGALWAVKALAELGRAERAAPLLAMLSPVSHGRTPDEVAVYRTEPYVIAADVYGVAPHVGRGGWTWYTGSAGWMFRVALESVLGVTLADGDTLVLRPCVPAAWPGFTVRYRLADRATTYEIVVRRVDGDASARVDDGEAIVADDGALRIPVVRDGRMHRVDVALGVDVGPRYAPLVPR